MSRAAVPQLSFRAVVLSVILAMILAAANAYLGLFAGLTIATAIPAAVVSMAVLRVLGVVVGLPDDGLCRLEPVLVAATRRVHG